METSKTTQNTTKHHNKQPKEKIEESLCIDIKTELTKKQIESLIEDLDKLFAERNIQALLVTRIIDSACDIGNRPGASHFWGGELK